VCAPTIRSPTPIPLPACLQAAPVAVLFIGNRYTTFGQVDPVMSYIASIHLAVRLSAVRPAAAQ
jgi:hypothetical protein